MHALTNVVPSPIEKRPTRRENTLHAEKRQTRSQRLTSPHGTGAAAQACCSLVHTSPVLHYIAWLTSPSPVERSMGKRLTLQRLAALAGQAREAWASDDHGARGTGRLVARGSPSGVVRFYVRHPRKSRSSLVEPLGVYSHVDRPGYLTLAKARELADCRLAGISSPRAKDPLPRPHEAASRPGRPVLTFRALCEGYVQALTSAQKVSANSVAKKFKRHIYNCSLSAKAAANITTADFTELLRDVISKSGQGEAGRLRSLLSTAYNHARIAEHDPSRQRLPGADALLSNPLEAIPVFRSSQVGTRALSRAELAAYWQRLHGKEITSTTFRALRLALVLGGQRGEQLLRVQLADINLSDGTILLRDGKGLRGTPRLHVLPICEDWRHEIVELIELAKASGSSLLFPGRGADKPLIQSTLSKRVNAISDELVADGSVSSGFCFADLRRTVETRMAELGIAAEIRNQIQSHDLGGIAMRHYNRHNYLAEKRAALECWYSMLRSLIEAPASK